MNYIKHLTGFFDRVVPDDRLNPTHISLYLSLFQFWNINRFQNPISICREETMKVSKICSKATYHKCMKDLHNFGYVKYMPSYNPFKGSLVHLVIFDPDYKPVQQTDGQPFKNQSGNETTTGTGTEQALVPSINNTNLLNIINDSDANSQTQFSKNENLPFSENNNPGMLQSQNSKRKKVAPKKEKPDSIPPIMEEVIAFFNTEQFPIVEANKFYNHFESNGWRVGGKTPMKNWQAAARNWMLNAQHFIAPQGLPKPQSKPQPSPNGKNYNEPL
ncbi:MAG TPA: hypothetical protein PK252_04355 [Bacteroidales bacterium]|nr:hypothetical protein [Bacteroidales bacterium]